MAGRREGAEESVSEVDDVASRNIWKGQLRRHRDEHWLGRFRNVRAMVMWREQKNCP